MFVRLKGMPMVIDGHRIPSGRDKAFDSAEIDELIVQMDRSGVDKVAAENLRSEVPDLDECVFLNRELAKAMRHSPDRILGMAVINPRLGEPMLDSYRECVEEHGMVGCKLWLACKADDPSMDPFVEYNLERRRITFIHSWYRNGIDPYGGRESWPENVINLARRHPEAAIVQMHHGGPWYQGALMTKYAPVNVYQGISALEGMGLLETLVGYLGARRIVWGCDMRRFSSRATVLAADISETDKSLILGDNLARLIEGVWDHTQ